eukprot:s2061_g12.t1
MRNASWHVEPVTRLMRLLSLLYDKRPGAKYDKGGRITLHNDALRWVVKPAEASERFPPGSQVYRKVALIYYLTKALVGRVAAPEVRKAAFFAYLNTVQASCFASFIALLLGFRVDHGFVAAMMLRLLRTRFATFAGSCQVLDTGNPIVYLSNHRSWGDFWTDCALLGGLPGSSALWGHFAGWLWFFVRGAHHEGGAVAWMTNFLSQRIRNFASKGVLLYPEGTRSLLPEGLPLKAGALAAAYQLGWPVQVVITTNKERVTAERSFAVNFGTLCSTAVSAPEERENEMVRLCASSPGAKAKVVTFSPSGTWQLHLLRLALSLLILLFLRFRARRRRSQKEEKKHEDTPAMSNGCMT